MEIHNAWPAYHPCPPYKWMRGSLLAEALSNIFSQNLCIPWFKAMVLVSDPCFGG